MVIRVLNIVEHCYSDADGEKVYKVIVNYIKRQEPVVVSFEGVDVVPSSFVNAAFITLLDNFSFETIKKLLSFVNTTSQTNEMIKNRFLFEVKRKKLASHQ